MAENHGEEAPKKAIQVADTTDKGKLEQVKRDVDTETRKLAIEKGDPIAKMKLNLAWAKQYPDHEIAKSIKGLGNYGDLTTNKEAAAAAVAKMVEIQKKLGISDVKGQDGIVGRGTLKASEGKEKNKEREEAQKLITELDQSLYTPDLQKRTEQAKKETPGGTDVLRTFWEKGYKEAIGVAKNAIKGTVVEDAKGEKYKVSTSAEGKPQYTNKDGEVFEFNTDKKLVQIETNKTKMKSILKRAESEKSDFSVEDPLRSEGVITVSYLNGTKSITNDIGEKYNEATGRFEQKKETTPESSPKTILATLKDMNNKKGIDGAVNLDALKANKALKGMTLTEEKGVILAEKDGQKVYLTRNKEKNKWDISDKSPAEQAKEKYKADQVALGNMIDPVLDWKNTEDESYRNLKISEYESKIKKFYSSDEGDKGSEGILPSGKNVYLGHVTAQAYIENLHKELGDEGRKTLSDAGVTFGELIQMKSGNEYLAANKLAAKDKPGKLPASLGKPNSQYQKINDKVFVLQEGEALPKVLLSDGKTQNIREQFNDTGTHNLPGGKELRVTLDSEGKKVFRIAQNKSADPEWVVNEKGGLEKIKKV